MWNPEYFHEHKYVGPFCPLQLLAHGGVLPHRITFLRSRRHDQISCVAFSHHFLSKEVNKKWHLVLTIVWCSLLTLLCESIAKESPFSGKRSLERLIMVRFCLNSHCPAQTPCVPKRSVRIAVRTLHYSLGWIFLVVWPHSGTALCQQHWCTNIKSHALETGSDSVRQWWTHRTVPQKIKPL